MPRLRPLRKQEDIAKVPQDQKVMIELEPEGVVHLDTNQDEEDAEKAKLLQERKEREAEDAKRAKEDADGEKPDEEKVGLLKQLEEMKKAAEESRAAALENDRLRQEAIKRAADEEAKTLRYADRATQAEYETVLTAIAAAEAEAESGSRDLENAMANADAKAAADAQRKIARAEARLMQLEDGKQALESRQLEVKERIKNPPAPERPATVEAYIDSLPGLLPSQRTWLKEHPDAMTDTRKNTRLQGIHFEAEDLGLQVGTRKYFDYLEERMGYKEPPKRTTDDDDDEVEREPRRPLVSAPVSRESTSAGTGRPSSTRITLTPEQREAARMSGIDEVTYARNLLKLQGLKADGHYTGN